MNDLLKLFYYSDTEQRLVCLDHGPIQGVIGPGPLLTSMLRAADLHLAEVAHESWDMGDSVGAKVRVK